MIVDNPEVTLEEEGHGFPEGAEEKGGLEFSISVHAHGDDGRQYWIECAILGYPRLNVLGGILQGADMCLMAVRWETGKVVQSRGSVYKIADFPPVGAMTFQHNPAGSLTIKRAKNQVVVEVGHARFTIKDDKTWHYSVEDKEKGLKAELVHAGVGFPTWYHDKKKLEAYTHHSIGGGYFWSGTVEGTLTIEGRKVRIKGKGCRQRYYAADYSSEEVGGWHDWTWFHFDEAFGGLDEMKVSKHKVMSLYLVDEKRYFSDGTFDIEHHDWAYLPPLGAFIPTCYKVTMETEAGVLEMAANVVGSYCWAMTEVPDCPFAILDWDKLEGTFIYKDGRKRTLTNGIGGTVIRLWRPYPNFIPEIAGAGMPYGR